MHNKLIVIILLAGASFPLLGSEKTKLAAQTTKPTTKLVPQFSPKEAAQFDQFMQTTIRIPPAVSTLIRAYCDSEIEIINRPKLVFAAPENFENSSLAGFGSFL